MNIHIFLLRRSSLGQAQTFTNSELISTQIRAQSIMLAISEQINSIVCEITHAKTSNRYTHIHIYSIPIVNICLFLKMYNNIF